MGSTSRSAGHPTRLQARLAAAAIFTVGSGLGIGMAGIAPAAADPGSGNGNGNAYGLAQGNEGPATPAQAPGAAPIQAQDGNGGGRGPAQGGGGGKAGGHAGGKGRSSHAPGRASTQGNQAHGNQAPSPAPASAQVNGGRGAANQGSTGSSADPAGNNGTVKIAPLGELDGIPDNTPHPGCTFQIEWYGYDEGTDIVSTVSFAEQAPTTGVGLSVNGPAQVFVGGDPATGAGTPTGLDGTQAYTLSFTGAPHPQQGYHVKLTVSTPRSLGNDTKTKVFWVEDCEAAPATTPEGPAPTGTSDAHDVHGQSNQEHGHQGHGASHVHPTSDVEVLGEQAFAAPTVIAPVVRSSAAAALPTAVNAGAAGSAAPVTAETSLLGLLLVLMGGLAGRLAWTRRARG